MFFSKHFLKNNVYASRKLRKDATPCLYSSNDNDVFENHFKIIPKIKEYKNIKN